MNQATYQVHENPGAEQLRFGNLVGVSWDILLRNFPLLVGLTFVMGIASSTATTYFSAMTRQALDAKFLAILFLLFAVSAIGNCILSSVALYTVANDWQGRPVKIATAVARGATTSLRAVPTAFAVEVGGLAGVLLLIVPAFIWATGMFVAVPLAIAERRGVAASISRSWSLTAGHRWTFLGVALVAGAPACFHNLLASHMTTFAAGVGDLGELGLWLSTLLVFVICACNALVVVAESCAYFFLVSSKEGMSADKIASAFD